MSLLVFRKHTEIWEVGGSGVQEKSSVRDLGAHGEDTVTFMLPPSHGFALYSAHCEESWDNKFGGDFKGHWS